MAIDKALLLVIEEFIRWASNVPTINRLWIFGSRLKGTQITNSDLDVAYEIDSLKDQVCRDQFHIEALPKWKQELEDISKRHYGIKVDVKLEPFIPNGKLDSWLKCCSMLIYERPND